MLVSELKKKIITIFRLYLFINDCYEVDNDLEIFVCSVNPLILPECIVEL